MPYQSDCQNIKKKRCYNQTGERLWPYTMVIMAMATVPGPT